MKTYTCCFCGKDFTGWGNNPDCWDDRKLDYENDCCCDDCNMKVVLPARMKAIARS